jgi:hypothetical protein
MAVMLGSPARICSVVGDLKYGASHHPVHFNIGEIT